jgi:hypothetical protein
VYFQRYLEDLWQGIFFEPSEEFNEVAGRFHSTDCMQKADDSDTLGLQEFTECVKTLMEKQKKENALTESVQEVSKWMEHESDKQKNLPPESRDQLFPWKAGLRLCRALFISNDLEARALAFRGLLMGVRKLKSPEQRCVWIGLAMDEIQVLDLLAERIECVEAWEFLCSAAKHHFQPRLLAWGLLGKFRGVVCSKTLQPLVLEWALGAVGQMLNFQDAEHVESLSNTAATTRRGQFSNIHAKELKCRVRMATLSARFGPQLTADCIAQKYNEYEANKQVHDLMARVWNGFAQPYLRDHVGMDSSEVETAEDLPRDDLKSSFVEGVQESMDEIVSEQVAAALLAPEAKLMQFLVPTSKDEISIQCAKFRFLEDLLSSQPSKSFGPLRDSKSFLEILLHALQDGTVSFPERLTRALACALAMHGAQNEIDLRADAAKQYEAEAEAAMVTNRPRIAGVHDSEPSKPDGSTAKGMADVREQSAKARRDELEKDHSWIVVQILKHKSVVEHLVRAVCTLAHGSPQSESKNGLLASYLCSLLRSLLVLHHPIQEPEGYEMTQASFGVAVLRKHDLANAIDAVADKSIEVQSAVYEVTAHVFGYIIQDKWWKITNRDGRGTEQLSSGQHVFADLLKECCDAVASDFRAFRTMILSCLQRWHSFDVAPLPQEFGPKQTAFLALGSLLWNVSEVLDERVLNQKVADLKDIAVEPFPVTSRYKALKEFSKIPKERMRSTCFHRTCSKVSAEPQKVSDAMWRAIQICKRILDSMEEQRKQQTARLVAEKRQEAWIDEFLKRPAISDVRQKRLERLSFQCSGQPSSSMESPKNGRGASNMPPQANQSGITPEKSKSSIRKMTASNTAVPAQQQAILAELLRSRPCLLLGHAYALAEAVRIVLKRPNKLKCASKLVNPVLRLWSDLKVPKIMRLLGYVLSDDGQEYHLREPTDCGAKWRTQLVIVLLKLRIASEEACLDNDFAQIAALNAQPDKYEALACVALWFDQTLSRRTSFSAAQLSDVKQAVKTLWPASTEVCPWIFRRLNYLPKKEEDIELFDYRAALKVDEDRMSQQLDTISKALNDMAARLSAKLMDVLMNLAEPPANQHNPCLGDADETERTAQSNDDAELQRALQLSMALNQSASSEKANLQKDIEAPRAVSETVNPEDMDDVQKALQLSMGDEVSNRASSPDVEEDDVDHDDDDDLQKALELSMTCPDYQMDEDAELQRALQLSMKVADDHKSASSEDANSRASEMDNPQDMDDLQKALQLSMGGDVSVVSVDPRMAASEADNPEDDLQKALQLSLGGDASVVSEDAGDNDDDDLRKALELSMTCVDNQMDEDAQLQAALELSKHCI